jgi:hypothetical protein
MVSRIGKAATAAIALLLAGSTSASAEQGAPQPVPQAAPGPVQPGGPPFGIPMPDQFKLNMMIRTAIIALNQANQTGNYTVLRDLGANSFRMSNDPSRLAEIFAALRKRQLDLSPILFFTPKITQQPQIDQRGLLRLTGFFPTAPEQVVFDIYYAFEGGQWRLFGIGVLMRPVEATAALPGPAAALPGSQPNAAGAQQPTAAPGPLAAPTAKRAPAPAPKSAAKNDARPIGTPSPTPAKPAVENRTTNNTARIQLGSPGSPPAAPQAPQPEAAPQSEGDAAAASPAAKEKPEAGFFPFW